MSTMKRQTMVNRYQYCTNCLARSHKTRACTSRETCKRCDKFHHTLLHASTPRSRRIKEVRTADLRQRKQQRIQQQQQQHPKEMKDFSTPAAISNLRSTSKAETRVIIDAIHSLATLLSGTCQDKSHP